MTGKLEESRVFVKVLAVISLGHSSGKGYKVSRLQGLSARAMTVQDTSGFID
jgi:hypothetical protein